MGFGISVSEGARYRVLRDSVQDRVRVRNVRLFDIRRMSTPTSVYAEMTPNPEVMKFVADRPLIDGPAQAEFTSKAECAGYSSLAEELFNFPFVTGVFISGTFVSVTKDDSLGWEMIAMQMREYIQQWLTEHATAVEEVPPVRTTAAPAPDAPLAEHCVWWIGELTGESKPRDMSMTERVDMSHVMFSECVTTWMLRQ